MKFKEEVENTGRIPDYHFEDEEELKQLLITKNKPSARGINTKIGLKTISLLRKIEKETNHSWYKELRTRNANNLEKTALFYRANEISYKKMFDIADIYAKSMKKIGINKGDEIACCMANVPELIYMMLAANKIGAVLNIFDPNCNSDYIREIIDGTSKKLLFCTDDCFDKIKEPLSKIHVDNKVLISLADSLPEEPELCNEYEPEFEEYYHFDNKVQYYKSLDNEIKTQTEFLELGNDYDKEIIDNNDINTDFTITYTSGSTRKGYPKPMIHTNRSYIIGGIYNDSNLTGSPEVPEIRGMAHVHSSTNTDLVTCISDNLMKKGSVALEPLYDKNQFLDCLFINKPVHVDATPSFLIAAAKQYLIDGKHSGKKLPMMLCTMSAGERTTPSEEKFINKFLKAVKAGNAIDLNGIHLPYGPLSVGGGDCEHGGIFYTLLKGLQEKVKGLKTIGAEFGMAPAPFAVSTALKLNENGEFVECDYNEYGVIVANSITSMKGYKNNKEKTINKIIRDNLGRDWLSCDVYGYINNVGNVVVKGRAEDVIKINDNDVIPCFMIDDVVTKDTKNVLSSSTVQVESNGKNIPIINVEFSPLKQKNTKSILISIEKRIKKYLPKFIYDNVMIRLIDNENSFPLTPSGKRNVLALKDMGLDNVYKLYNGTLVKEMPTVIDGKITQKEQKVLKKLL